MQAAGWTALKENAQPHSEFIQGRYTEIRDRVNKGGLAVMTQEAAVDAWGRSVAVVSDIAAKASDASKPLVEKVWKDSPWISDIMQHCISISFPS